MSTAPGNRGVGLLLPGKEDSLHAYWLSGFWPVKRGYLLEV